MGEGGRLSDYTQQQRRLEVLAIVLFAVLVAWSLWRLGSADGIRVGLIVAAAACGWLAADFFSGVVHWGFDTWGSLRTPWLGPRFIRPFREHHVDPLSITRHDFVETNGASCIAVLPVLLATAFMPLSTPGWQFTHAALAFTALGVLLTNQCHKWAHADPSEVPRIAGVAQRLGLILRPRHHLRHHAWPFDSHFCTASGWLNRPLQAVGFFRILSRAIGAHRKKPLHALAHGRKTTDAGARFHAPADLRSDPGRFCVR